mmetsp:Transcript_31965/g.91128  ORF Transcript_31965/g.91128 Transcript_31965/m.91128 type:complete len:154 (+) Transcript_31965:85-546(+)
MHPAMFVPEVSVASFIDRRKCAMGNSFIPGPPAPGVAKRRPHSVSHMSQRHAARQPQEAIIRAWGKFARHSPLLRAKAQEADLRELAETATKAGRLRMAGAMVIVANWTQVSFSNYQEQLADESAALLARLEAEAAQVPNRATSPFKRRMAVA